MFKTIEYTTPLWVWILVYLVLKNILIYYNETSFFLKSLGTIIEQLKFEELGKEFCAKGIVDEGGVSSISYFNSWKKCKSFPP